MRVFLILGGAILGVVLAFQGKGWLGAMAGAFIGYAVAEFAAWRARVQHLENEVAELRRRLAARDADATVSANAAATPESGADAATPPGTAAPRATPLSGGPTRPAPTLSPAYESSGYSPPRP